MPQAMLFLVSLVLIMSYTQDKMGGPYDSEIKLRVFITIIIVVRK